MEAPGGYMCTLNLERLLRPLSSLSALNSHLPSIHTPSNLCAAPDGLPKPTEALPPIDVGGVPIETPKVDPNLLPDHFKGLITSLVRHLHTALEVRRGGRQHITAKDYAYAKDMYAAVVVLLSRISPWPTKDEMGDAAMLVSTAVRLTMRIVHDNQHGATKQNFFEVCAAAGFRGPCKDDYIALINQYERDLLCAIEHRCHVADEDAAAAVACVSDWLVSETLAARQGCQPDPDVENFGRCLARPLELAIVKPAVVRRHRHLLKPVVALTALPARPSAVAAAGKIHTFRHHCKDVDAILPAPQCPAHLRGDPLLAAI